MVDFPNINYKQFNDNNRTIIDEFNNNDDSDNDSINSNNETKETLYLSVDESYQNNYNN